MAPVLLVLGVLALFWGVLQFLAGAMSDAPSEGESNTKAGAIIAGIGLLSIIGSIVIFIKG